MFPRTAIVPASAGAPLTLGCAVYLPGAGWVEFDPTNGIVGSDDLIRVAVVRDPRQAVPVSGTWTGFPSDALGMTVEVEVTAETATEPSARTRSVMTPGASVMPDDQRDVIAFLKDPSSYDEALIRSRRSRRMHRWYSLPGSMSTN